MADEFAHFDDDPLVTKDFLRAELSEMRGSFHDDIVQQTRWLIGVMLTWGTLLVGVVALLD